MVKFRLSKKAASKLLAVLMALLLVAVYAPLVSVGAASKTVIKSVDDLKNISKNLSGTYELGANIDCKGVSMSPIGNLAKPFTGTFTCPTGANGKPTYAITNLTINVKIGGDRKSQQGQYKANGDSNWCVGLFGAAKDAKFQNIVVLNANVSSDVIGGSDTGSSYSETYKGTDEQGTGIMCGIAVGTTFKNCGVQGTVTSASNNVGGFVGQAGRTVNSTGNGNKPLMSGKSGTTAQNCYAYANVNSTGSFQWNAGGFVGNATKSTFTGSFFEGTLAVTTGTSMAAGGFVGCISSSTFKACYSAGSFTQGGYYPGAFAGQFTGHNAAADRCKQCYSNIKMGETPFAVEANDKSGNFVTPNVGAEQTGFAVKSIADINAKFASNDLWNTYGDGATLPTVKALTGKTVKTLAELDTPKQSGSSDKTSSSGKSKDGTDSADSEVSDDEAKAELIKEIVAAKDADAVAKLFKDLGVDVPEDVVKAVFDKAAEKGEELTVDDLKAAGLTDEQLDAAVTALEEKMANDEDETGNSGNGSGTVTVKTDGKISSISTAEWILIIVLSALILLALAGSVVLIILLIKALKGIKGGADAAVGNVTAAANEISVSDDKPIM